MDWYMYVVCEVSCSYSLTFGIYSRFSLFLEDPFCPIISRFCLFNLILYIPINNFSVMPGWDFLN